MTTAPATLSDFVSVLSGQAPEMPAIFQTQDGDIGAGFHITELKLADISSIDCIGRQSQWREAQMQLLDGQDGEHLTVGKVSSILQRCIAGLPGLADAPLSIEFAHANQGLGQYTLGSPRVSEAGMILPLVNQSAQCKPAVELSCCGPTSSCCG